MIHFVRIDKNHGQSMCGRYRVSRSGPPERIVWTAWVRETVTEMHGEQERKRDNDHTLALLELLLARDAGRVAA